MRHSTQQVTYAVKDATSKIFIITICFLSVGGLISTDIFLPALPSMSQFYHSSEENIQSCIAIFLFGISVTQLIYGPLTDSLGRKKVLLAGLTVWLAATIGIFFSSTINELLILRLFQGIGACAGITISRAIISDKLDREEAGNLYLTIFPFVGMSPAIAPMIGGILDDHFGWKSCFLFLTVFIVITLFLCLFFLDESLPKEKRQPLHHATLARNTIEVLRHRKFLYFAAVPCFAYAIYFAYIVESPFILTSLGLDDKYVGYTYFTLSLTYVLGNITAKKISRKIGAENAIAKGYQIFLIGGCCFALQMFVSNLPILTSIASISILTFGNGFLLPLGTACAISSKSDLSGTASGIMGCLQLGSAALSSFLIGIISQHQASTTGMLIAASSVLGFSLYWFGRTKTIQIQQTQGN